MSYISIAIQDVLKSTAAVTAVVNNRVYPDVLPRVNDADPTLPAITVLEVSDPPSGNARCQRTARVQVSCWSNPPSYNGVKSPQQVEQLAEAVLTALHHSEDEKYNTVYSVIVEGTTKNYHVIGQRALNSGPRLRDPDTDYYHKPVDFEVIYRKLED